MKDEISIAIVGATGVVGSEIIAILTERNFPLIDVRLFASESSTGEVYSVANNEAEIEVINEDSFNNIDIVFIASTIELSQKWVATALESGAYVIDCSAFHRMNQEVPLIVSGVNLESLSKESKLIANPASSAIQLASVLKVIHNEVGIKRVVLSTYQSVSGAGKDALDELWEQTQSMFTQQDLQPEKFHCQIAFNCIPQIDIFSESGETKEEERIVNETRKILDLPELKITCTAVRVPVFHSHAQSLNIETKKNISAENLKKLFDKTEGLTVFFNDASYPMHIDASGMDEILIGRIRDDKSSENCINLWTVTDNLRKGAALNAVQIAEFICKKL